MNLELIHIIILSFIGSVAGLIGGVIFLIKREWAKTLSLYAVPFAAGVLITVSLLHLLPEATHEVGEKAYYVVLVAFLGSFLFEKFFANLHHHEHRKSTTHRSSIPLVIFGDTIHNFIDGVAIASAYLADPAFGLIVALATFLHETPHEIGDFGILMKAGWSSTKTFTANALSALATFPGAFFVFFLVRDAHEKIGVLLAISAGVFLFLGAADFLPEVGEDGDKKIAVKEVFFLLLGVTVMVLLKVLSPAH